MPQPEPFWLCHECGAQMRPITIDGVSHCASCNGEFLEILDSDINPDPFHELPPPPPTRPGASTDQPQADQGTGFVPNFLSNLFGGMPQPTDQQQNRGQAQTGGPRTFQWNIGGGHGSITFGRFDGNMNAFGGGGPPGLDAFFPGFPPPPRGGQGRGGPELDGVDLLQALMAIIQEDGANGGPRGNLGDYVMNDQGFNDVLERLMQAAGPQGPLPASDVVIEGLPRIKFEDEASLEKSSFKDCPVCKDDFIVGDEVMRVPCGHIFHPDCLQPWLRVNGSCPVCRFSLVPEEGNQRRGAETRPNPATQPTSPGAQTTVTSILNRLWGQGGQAGASESTDQPSGSSGPSSTAPSSASGRPSENAEQASSSQSEPAADTVRLSSGIPQDYRDRHARREREQQQRPPENHDPYLDDLD